RRKSFLFQRPSLSRLQPHATLVALLPRWAAPISRQLCGNRRLCSIRLAPRIRPEAAANFPQNRPPPRATSRFFRRSVFCCLRPAVFRHSGIFHTTQSDHALPNTHAFLSAHTPPDRSALGRAAERFLPQLKLALRRFAHGPPLPSRSYKPLPSRMPSSA